MCIALTDHLAAVAASPAFCDAIYNLQGAVPVELSIERLLRRSTADALLKLVPALLTTAQRYSNKRSAPTLGGAWKPPTMAAAAAAAATAAEVAAAGSDGGSNAALVNTWVIKLMGSLKAWWPGCATAEQCQQVIEGEGWWGWGGVGWGVGGQGRVIKLMGSLKAWWPGCATAEQCQQVIQQAQQAGRCGGEEFSTSGVAE
jgi:exonuclease VII small subunit